MWPTAVAGPTARATIIARRCGLPRAMMGGGIAASLRCRLAEACVASGDTASARRLLLQARAAATPTLKPRLALAEGFLLEAEGRADTALMRYGDAATRSAAYGRMAAVYGGSGDGHKAADCAARCVALADSLAASVSAVGVGGLANRRWAERRERESFLKNSVSTTSPRYGCM